MTEEVPSIPATTKPPMGSLARDRNIAHIFRAMSSYGFFDVADMRGMSSINHLERLAFAQSRRANGCTDRGQAVLLTAGDPAPSADLCVSATE